jgi:predicted NAD-dependent protein-ADP-ribosyltransferase YbiA (DUF1768 family)
MFLGGGKKWFSAEKKIEIEVKSGSEASKLLRKKKTYEQIALQRKMRAEWFYIGLAVGVVFNTIYNSFPQSRLARNLFLDSEDNLIVSAREEVLERVRASENKK